MVSFEISEDSCNLKFFFLLPTYRSRGVSLTSSTPPDKYHPETGLGLHHSAQLQNKKLIQ